MTRRRGKRLLAVIALALVLATIALIAWLNTPVGEVMPEALHGLDTSAWNSVVGNIVDSERWIVFEQFGKKSTIGFIFYPGSRVAAEAYAPLARDVAATGRLAVIVPMPLNFAIFNPDAAGDVIAAYPRIQHWVIGGHSFGGVMAARFAYNNPGLVDGLVLLAAYPEAHSDLSQRDLPSATIYGDRDGLTTVSGIEASFSQLPRDARKVLIVGGNHSQFGWYGLQSGDQSAGISPHVQNAQIVNAVLQVMQDAGN